MSDRPPVQAAEHDGGRSRSLRGRVQPATLVVGIVILIGAVVLAALAQVVNQGSNQRLANQQVRQAATTLSAALPSVQVEMLDGLQVYRATRSAAAFEHLMSSHVGRTGFASVSLWGRSGSTVNLLARVGAEPSPALNPQDRSFLRPLAPSAALQVAGLLPDGPSERIGFAEMPPGDPDLIVYAESAVPAHHRLTVPRTSPFSDLDFALYLGRTTNPSQLIESSAPVPIGNLRASTTLPFGDTFITVVGTPRSDLAGGLSAALPWIVLGAGVAFAAGSMVLAEYVTRRRGLAEALAGENERLYLEQRSIASDFQQALLPDLPEFHGLEVAARYIAGTIGLDVGGDWYDVVQSGPRTCTFVVGDVCGRGLQAATTMAALRFASRAYLTESADPVALIEKLGRLPGLPEEAFATVLVGTIDGDNRTLVVASAGHPPPLLLDGTGASFVEVRPTVPIGVSTPRPEAVTVTVPSGAVLIAYTDGLVERRGESIDSGLERMAALGLDGSGQVDEVLDRLVAGLLPGGADDDAAILALKWEESPAGAGTTVPLGASRRPGWL